MKIREVRSDDGPAMAALLDQLGYPGTNAFITDKIERLRAEADSGILVATDSERLLGFLAYHFFVQLGLAGDFCRIAYFCVDESARSAGVGATLEATLESMARQRGCDRIEVHCSAYRTQAHGFYGRQGYTESPKYLIKTLA
jgi:GNAT superfamily N-acetyltransferase